jgi:hypothetical protein
MGQALLVSGIEAIKRRRAVTKQPFKNSKQYILKNKDQK